MRSFRQWSIVTKLTVAIVGLVSLLLLIGHAVLMQFQASIFESLTHDNLAEVTRILDDREQSEKTTLHRDMCFTTDILNEIGNIFLFRLEAENMQHLLASYIKHSEILAIRVLDDDGEPFAAAWKDPEIQSGPRLPDDLPLDDAHSFTVDALRREEFIGTFQLYYSDAALTQKIAHARKEAARNSSTLQAFSQRRLHQLQSGQLIGMLAILVVLVGALIFMLRFLIFRPLSNVSHVAHSLADLNLTVETRSRRTDELGDLFQALDTMTHSFRRVLSRVQSSGNQVASSSAELAATAKQQDVVVKTQFDAMMEVMQATREISDVITTFTDSIRTIASRLQNAASLASSRQADLSRMEHAMRQLERASQAISGELHLVSDKAKNITGVVTTITKVAEQTNLLSLNAAIEAEKAGETGRGFTVVAREIRRLADQTAVATLDIERMVAEMQAAMAVGTGEMETFIQHVRQHAEVAEQSSALLSEMIDEVHALAPEFDTMNHAMEEQAENARHVTNAMTRLRDEMHETSQTLHESFSAIEQLDAVVRTLQAEVSQFRVD